MPRALILVADGSEEIEFVTPYDVLTRADFEVKSAGISLRNEFYAQSKWKQLTVYSSMSRNIRIVPDYQKLEYTFCEDSAVLDLINDFRRKGKWVATICAATTVLVAAEKKRRGDDGDFDGDTAVVTGHPSVMEEIVESGWGVSQDRVVVDGNLITSRGPGTAILFALTIVEYLCGKEKRDKVAGPMVLAETL
ncbi:protein DJ-1 [Alternaria panax]|uniref:D-lactate dehydratase n=1 Tax=Alternaria panax TaxID=48097 RepID=A0AAD4I6S6_9PLEO|nr:protein DJ-1 [Alternaria panax]